MPNLRLVVWWGLFCAFIVLLVLTLIGIFQDHREGRLRLTLAVHLMAVLLMTLIMAALLRDTWPLLRV